MTPPEAQLIDGLRELVARLEETAAEAAALDPLLELGATLSVAGAAPIRVELVVSRSSGHGPESAHVIEDRLALKLAAGWARAITFEREGLPEERLPGGALRLTPAGIAQLLAAVRAFCAEVLPSPCALTPSRGSRAGSPPAGSRSGA
jgi:hypothetical protein